MSLTFSSGPLAGHPPETVNYRIDGPAHKLLMQEFPRRVRATFGGETVFDTTRAMLLHETGLLPQVYVPLDDIRADLRRPTDHHTYCPFKGTASYWSVTAGGQVAENAIWYDPDPNEESRWLQGYAGFYWDAMDEGTTRTSASRATSVTRTTGWTCAVPRGPSASCWATRCWRRPAGRCCFRRPGCRTASTSRGRRRQDLLEPSDTHTCAHTRASPPTGQSSPVTTSSPMPSGHTRRPTATPPR